MDFADFIIKKAIKPRLEAKQKEEAIREMVHALVDSGEIGSDQYDGIVQKVLDREQLGSTGIGRGVAVPHTKHPSVERLCGAVAVSEGGVEFSSLDGDPVNILFLLVSPPDRPGDHLRALENVSRKLRDDQFCRLLRQSNTSDDVWQLLMDADKDQFGS
ncbi:PTS sugar transporter subunit IIA [Botrimarina sp.]|uniref:PTS sugar transporter subunit IIA n=1 Tax=Botrimarina sp. TaxID=2795802 RepID=UPI0032EB4DC6